MKEAYIFRSQVNILHEYSRLNIRAGVDWSGATTEPWKSTVKKKKLKKKQEQNVTIIMEFRLIWNPGMSRVCEG